MTDMQFPPVIPVAALESLEDGLKVCETLIAAGLPAIEVTFRTEAAEEIIRTATREFPDMVIGAGTVLTTDNLQRAMDAGAQFAVAPGLNPKVVQAAQQQSFPFFPGVCTPTDVECAVDLGCRRLKFFPAEAAGGVQWLKALLGPYGHLGLEFCPTGGISAENMTDYLALPEVFAIGGSWMAKKHLIGDWDQMIDKAKDAVARAQSVT